MPVNFSQLKGNIRTINVPYFGDNLSLSYRPSQITPQAESEDKARAEAGEDNVLADRLTTIVTAWDLVDEENQVIPVTQEFMRTVPSPLLSAIREAIMEDAAPKKKSAGKSFAR